MKHIILLLAMIAFCLIGNIYGLATANSIAFSGSYLLRAYGAEALYWNPANLNSNYYDIVLPGVNQAFQIGNNSFDISDYNYISGRYLKLKDKNMILDNVDRRLILDGQAHIFLLGLSFGKIGVASSSHVYSELRLSKKYLKLILLGNEDTDYTFKKANNQMNLLSFQDLTVGMGDIEISQYFKSEYLPEIRMGVAASALIGIGTIETEHYKGSFHSGFDGLAFKQDIKIKTGLGGIGTKALIGFVSQPVDNLDIGMSFDNLLGFIRWVGQTERLSYTITADSTYASELDDDIFTQVDSTKSIGKFSTKLPVEMRLGAKYRYKQASASIDWTQGFSASVLTNNIGRICVGTEYLLIDKIPIRFGLRFGNIDYPWGASYGLGYQGSNFDWGFGFQTFKSMFPGNHSKGISFSSNLSLHY